MISHGWVNLSFYLTEFILSCLGNRPLGIVMFHYFNTPQASAQAWKLDKPRSLTWKGKCNLP